MFRSFTTLVLIFVLTSFSPVQARTKYYQYDGDIPFIEMMLNMMSVMGILDKVPVNYMNSIAYSRFNNYYPGVSGLQLSPGGFNNYYPGMTGFQPSVKNPFARYNPYKSLSPGNGLGYSGCKSILCGNRVQLINGLWIAQNGEMLGIKDNKFLWNDGNERYLSGNLKVNDEWILASINGTSKTIRYQYKVNNGHLMVRHQNGVVKTFRKVDFGRNNLN